MRVRLWVLGAAAVIAASSARAEVNEVRFGRQLGLGYLQLYVAQELKLVEKHAAAAGLGDVKAVYQPIGTPAAITDAFLAGTVDFGAAGVPSLVILWDKTRTSYQAKALTALNAQPAFLNTVNPKIQTLKDFGDNDRIALPTVKTSFQAMALEMAAEQVFGPGQQARLDRLTVSMNHPDGTTALLSGRSEITAHFTSPPFQYQQLADPRVHRVLSSYEATGPATTFSLLWTSARFYQANPKMTHAVLAAMEEATDYIAAHRPETARIFLKVDNSKLAPEFVESMLADTDITYSVTPHGLVKIASFMARAGMIGTAPLRWQDMFFPDLHQRDGS